MEKITSLAESFEFIIEVDEVTKEPIGHPLAIWNFEQIYPEVSLQNLPEKWAFFRRKSIPNSILEKNSETFFTMPESRYEWNNGAVEDVWGLRDMTQQEIDSTFENTTRDFRLTLRLINNNIVLLKKWAEHNKSKFANVEEWEAWGNAIPTALPLPPEQIKT